MNAPSHPRTVSIVSQSTDPPFVGLTEKVMDAYPESAISVLSRKEAGDHVGDLTVNDRLVLCHDADRADLDDLVAVLRTRRVAAPMMVLAPLKGDAELRDLSLELGLPCVDVSCSSVDLASAFVSVYEPRDSVSGGLPLTVGESLFILIDPLLRISQVADALGQLLGMSSGALLGNTVATFVCEGDVALFTMDPGTQRESVFLADLVGADGTRFHVIVRRRDAFRDALFLGFLYTFTDVSDCERLQQRGERDLRCISTVKRELETTLDAIMDPIVVTDQHACVRRVNRAFAQRLGKPFSEIIGQSYHTLLAPDEPTSTALESLHVGTPVPSRAPELTLRPLKGAFNVDCFPRFTPEGSLVGWVHLMRPPLHHVEPLDSRLHDLRNSLTAILGLAGLLLVSKDVPDRLRADLRKIALEAERSADLAGSLLCDEE